MDNQTMFSKTIGLQKTAFNNTLAIFSTLQQHGEDFLKITLDESPWLPKSSKNACLYWADIYSKYLNNLRSVANQGFAEIERISSPGSKTKTKELPPEVTTEQVASPRSARKSTTVKEKTGNEKKTEATETSTGKLSATPEKPVEKRIPTKTPPEKSLTADKPQESKPDEVQAATPEPKPSVISQSPGAALAPEEKQSPKKPS